MECYHLKIYNALLILQLWFDMIIEYISSLKYSRIHAIPQKAYISCETISSINHFSSGFLWEKNWLDCTRIYNISKAPDSNHNNDDNDEDNNNNDDDDEKVVAYFILEHLQYSRTNKQKRAIMIIVIMVVKFSTSSFR